MAVAPLAVPLPGWRRPSRAVLVLVVLAGYVAAWIPLRGRHTLALSTSELTATHTRLNELRDQVDAARADSPFFTGFVAAIRTAVGGLATGLQNLISQPAYGRPVPLLGWLGVLAVAVLVAYAVGNARVAVLSGVGFGVFGLLGLWQESMDTLALTLAAVLIAVVVGVPLGVAVGLSPRALRLVTPVLDLMQTLPTFVYLAPLTLFFLIGPAAAVIVTLVYAIGPVIRITAHGIAEVPGSATEAGTSLGATGAQLLRRVRLPLARRMIVVGINQTTMCALSMVTIAALIDAPGLGRTTLVALQRLDVGAAFNAGLAIVVMAVVLDRVTSAAGQRAGRREAALTRTARLRRRGTLTVLCGLTLVAGYLAYTLEWAAYFPWRQRGGVFGTALVSAVNTASDFVALHLYDLTNALKDTVTYGLLNPLEDILTGSPWYLTAVMLLALGAVVGGVRVLPGVAVCLVALILTGLWQPAMATLAATLVATALTIALGLVVGVWMGRSARVDRLLRPTLDAAQVMPAFVYLVPFVGLFGPSRFTGIVAAVVFAAPVAVKLVAEGIRGVSPIAVEAAVASGSSTRQIVRKVQVPLARRSIALAANQGLIYVLSMVVVAGLVGGGALGYLVVAGFSQTSLYGKGLAAGLAIVLLGIGLDRVTQAAAHRSAGPHHSTRAYRFARPLRSSWPARFWLRATADRRA